MSYVKNQRQEIPVCNTLNYTPVIILRITHVHLNGFQNEELGRHHDEVKTSVVTFIFGIRHDEHELFSK